MNRSEILDRADSIINGERQNAYGSAEDNFGRIAMMWTAYLECNVTPQDVASMMVLLKIARNASGHYKGDNWIDICGYAALGGEMDE